MKEKIDSAKHTEQIKILFSRFSHELRNPLALLSSELQLLASSHPQLSNDEQWENILENLEYIHALLDDMSRYQNAGQLSLVLTDLSPCLNEISRSFRPVLKYPTGISKSSSQRSGIHQPYTWKHLFSCRIHCSICTYFCSG